MNETRGFVCKNSHSSQTSTQDTQYRNNILCRIFTVHTIYCLIWAISHEFHRKQAPESPEPIIVIRQQIQELLEVQVRWKG